MAAKKAKAAKAKAAKKAEKVKVRDRASRERAAAGGTTDAGSGTYAANAGNGIIETQGAGPNG